jgi:beta-galactosidase
MDFITLEDYVCFSYEVTCDGVVIDTGVLSEGAVDNILPHEEGKAVIPVTVPEAGVCYLKLNYLLKNKSPFLEAGSVLGFDEILLENKDGRNQTAAGILSNPVAEKVSTETFEIHEDDHYLTIETADFSYTYNKFTGCFKDMFFENGSLLDRPMEINIWRAPTDNDSDIKKAWLEAHYHKAISRAYETMVEIKEDRVEIKTVMSVTAAPVQRMLNINALWTIWKNGAVDTKLKVKKDGEFPELPRFGLRLFLPKEMDQVTYFGMGPSENYSDKKRASYHGLFQAHVKEMHEDYLRPQENGSRGDCDFVTVEGSRNRLSVASQKPFSFNASIYTQEELTQKAHNFELVPVGSTVLCLDYRQNGIGSESCGPDLRKEYMFEEEEFMFEVRLLPGRN